MRKMLAVLALAGVASTATAQGGGGMAGMPGMEATQKVTQTGPLPAGWQVRVDFPERGEKAEDLNFTAMGPGMHVTAGPHASFWNPANTASGTYTISAQFGVRKEPLHDAVGLFWGGSDMTGDNESYAYFIIYGDGGYTVKHRASAKSQTASARNNNTGDVHTVLPKAMNAAIIAAPADGGSATNTVEVRVASDSVRFVVNGTQVAAVDAKNPMMPNAGIYGFRVNHNIDVHISGFGKK